MAGLVPAIPIHRGAIPVGITGTSPVMTVGTLAASLTAILEFRCGLSQTLDSQDMPHPHLSEARA
ncbi:hypothetical protein CHELA40_50052 [Chelatococcus asaccharovorans]|nr:hypothetical protein CHELA17_20014 [Chelatococcus asaccharovorans]CAH1690950.1 hypothetical protein CHELA40_50052 [Chelatococcus asaccharovorans]